MFQTEKNNGGGGENQLFERSEPSIEQSFQSIDISFNQLHSSTLSSGSNIVKCFKRRRTMGEGERISCLNAQSHLLSKVSNQLISASISFILQLYRQVQILLNVSNGEEQWGRGRESAVWTLRAIYWAKFPMNLETKFCRILELLNLRRWRKYLIND